VREGRFTTHRGHVFGGEDILRARIIEALMCDFRVNRAELTRDFGASDAQLDSLFARAMAQFGTVLRQDTGGLSIPPEARPLTRMIARAFDAYDQTKAQHSAAI
jgi:oxygen-independent coproporphyrinogen-3 oxidase